MPADTTDALPIAPFPGPAQGRISLPGSKSVTNRALLLAALAEGTVILQGALFSRDTAIMAEALRALGIRVLEDAPAQTLTVFGTGPRIPRSEASLTVGNAGTAARFLTAFLALRQGGAFHLDGDEAMRRRPMRGLLDALRQAGARFEFRGQPDHFPFTMRPRGISGGTLAVDASASSQILSALLLVAPLASGPVRIERLGETVSHPFIDLTISLLEQFGLHTQERDGHRVFQFAGGGRVSIPEGRYSIEPDATAGSYFMALPIATGGTVEIEGAGAIRLQGDIRFTDVLESLGCTLGSAGPAGGDLRASATQLADGECLEVDFQPISDTFLTLAALAPILGRRVVLRGIAHTRHQETDRVAAMACELRRLGQQVQEDEDALTIEPDPAEMAQRALAARACGRLLTIETYEDHRVAMSFAILGSHNLLGDGLPWMQIADPMCCAKTFPGFFQTLACLRRQSAPADS